MAHHPAGESLGYPEHGAQGLHSPAASFRVQKFPSVNSYGFAGPAARASPSQVQPRPEASTPAEKPSARGVRFPSPVESAIWPPRPACRRTAGSSGGRSAGSPHGTAGLGDGLALVPLADLDHFRPGSLEQAKPAAAVQQIGCAALPGALSLAFGHVSEVAGWMTPGPQITQALGACINGARRC